MPGKLAEAFELAGYEVFRAESVCDALGLYEKSLAGGCEFSLALLDASVDEHTGLIGDMQHTGMPILVTVNDEDKSVIIDQLSHGRSEFLDHFIEMHKKMNIQAGPV